MTRRIAMISEHASPLTMIGGVDAGGQNVYVGEVAKQLASMGHQVDIFTRRDSELLPEIAPWVDGVRVIHVQAGPMSYIRKEELLPYMDQFLARTLRFMRGQRQPYDIVHANFWMSGLVACEIKKALDIPFVITFHALGYVRREHQAEADEFPDARFAIEERIVAEADQIIAECPQDEEDLIRLYNAEPARITIVPCGFEPAGFWPISKALARVVLSLAPDERIIVQVGRIVPRKGVDNVIRGFARLVHVHGVEAKLIVVGGNAEDSDDRVREEVARLEAIAREEGVADQVMFVGRRGRDDLKYFYSAADVFVTTPWYEPFGITPLEAMACGTPVVGSSVGGIKFTVRESETGYLVPARDPDALAERLAYLYKHPKLLNLLGKQAVRRVNDLFTWQRVAKSLINVYEDVILRRFPEQGDEAEELAAIDDSFAAAIEAFVEAQRQLPSVMLRAVRAITTCFEHGGKLMICGNGGSAAEAQHFACELVGRFRDPDRAALPAIALAADSTFLTAWSNDSSYDDVFARQVEAFAQPNDLLIGLSTSGRSPNLLRAFEAARRRGVQTLALLGGSGGQLRELADTAIVAPVADAQRIQELHAATVHMLCELVEARITGRAMHTKQEEGSHKVGTEVAAG